jgi:hypothetical protein
VRAAGFAAITPSGFGPSIASGLLLRKGRAMPKANATIPSCRFRSLGSALVGAFALAFSFAASADPAWDKVGEVIGKTGTEMPGGVYRIALPRADIKASLDGVELKPGFALGGWLAFQKIGDAAMVMGDLVLTSEEVNPVMAKLLVSGIEVTALHNHLLRNTPFTMYMHVYGHGDAVTLASALHEALTMSKTPLISAAPPAAPPQIDLDTAALEQILGAKGTSNGGVYGFGIRRAEPITDAGMTVPAAMGSAIAINFQPTGNSKAAITGDFVLIGSEVEPVIKALRENGIEVTAIHNHMIDEQPRLFFVHFWANDDAKKLAQGLKAALTHVNIAKS